MLLVFIAIAAATAVYPFIIYSNLQAWGPATLALGLFVLLLARVLVRGSFRQPEQYLQLILVGCLCMLAAVLQSEDLLRYYPVVMSLAFAAFFASSLAAQTSLIERFASMRGQSEFAPHQRSYMRRLTIVWALLLAVNATIAAYTACCMSLKSWTLYNGLISYLILGIFSLAELIVRFYYKKKHD